MQFTAIIKFVSSSTGPWWHQHWQRWTSHCRICNEENLVCWGEIWRVQRGFQDWYI